jgi:hypothetical protein
MTDPSGYRIATPMVARRQVQWSWPDSKLSPPPGGYWAGDVAGERGVRERAMAAGATMDKQALLAALPDLIAQTCDPEIEWVEDPQRADGRVYRGHEGLRESWERWSGFPRPS